VKVVSDKEFEEAIKNPDYIGICKFVIYQYKQKISKEELNSCIYQSIWQALRRFKPERNMKFTSYLYICARGTCYIAFKKNRNMKRRQTLTNCEERLNRQTVLDNHTIFDMELDDSNEDIQIVKERYLENLKLREIAERHDISIEGARHKIARGLELLK
jgi:RNA polymerase sigma factor (sigma-70 family)